MTEFFVGRSRLLLAAQRWFLSTCMVYLCILYAADGPTTPSELGDRALCRLATKKLEEIQENDSKIIEKS